MVPMVDEGVLMVVDRVRVESLVDGFGRGGATKVDGLGSHPCTDHLG